MDFDLNILMKAAPTFAGLLVALVYWVYRVTKKRSATLEDIFVVGITGSSFPSGILFIGAAFDPALLTNVSETPIYIALAGCAVLYIALKTLREKSVA